MNKYETSKAVIYLYPERNDISHETRLIRSAELCFEKYREMFSGEGDRQTPPPWHVEKTEKGKPYFPEHGNVNCSLSDSGTLVGVSVGSCRMGLDLQYRRRHAGEPERDDGPRLRKLAARAFCREECMYILEAEDGRRQLESAGSVSLLSDDGKKKAADRLSDRFFSVWTAKEAYVKYTGTGIDDSFSEFSVMPEHGTKSIRIPVCRKRKSDTLTQEVVLLKTAQYWKALDGFFYQMDFPKGYTLCLCTSEMADVEVVLWDSAAVES